jgi:hypothetical protein
MVDGTKIGAVETGIAPFAVTGVSARFLSFHRLA